MSESSANHPKKNYEIPIVWLESAVFDTNDQSIRISFEQTEEMQAKEYASGLEEQLNEVIGDFKWSSDYPPPTVSRVPAGPSSQEVLGTVIAVGVGAVVIVRGIVLTAIAISKWLTEKQIEKLIKELWNKIEELEKRIKDLQAQKQAHHNELNKLRDRIEELNGQNKKLTNQRNRFEQTEGKLRRQLKEIEELQTENEELSTHLQELLSTIEDFEKDLESVSLKKNGKMRLEGKMSRQLREAMPARFKSTEKKSPN